MPVREAVEFSDLAESEVFAEFFGIVRELTGIQVGLTDPSGDQAKLLFPRSAMNPLSLAIQSDLQGRAACQETDRINLALAARGGTGIHYRCHAGLVDLAVPIFVEGRHVATMNCGQVLAEPPGKAGFARFRKRNRRFAIKPQALGQAYFR